MKNGGISKMRKVHDSTNKGITPRPSTHSVLRCTRQSNREEQLGEHHPGVAVLLNKYAALMQKTGRPTEAADLKARAQAIHASQSQSIPDGGNENE